MSPEHLGNPDYVDRDQQIENPQHLENPWHLSIDPHASTGSPAVVHAGATNQPPRSSHGAASGPPPADSAVTMPVPDVATPTETATAAAASVPVEPSRPAKPAGDLPKPVATEHDLPAGHAEAERETAVPATFGQRTSAGARREAHSASDQTLVDAVSSHRGGVRPPVNQPAAHGTRQADSESVLFHVPAPAGRADVDASRNHAAASPAAAALAARLSRIAASVSTNADASAPRFVDVAADAQPATPQLLRQPGTFDFFDRGSAPPRHARGEFHDALTFARSGLTTMSPGLMHAAQPPVAAAPAAPVIAMTDADAAGNASELVQSIRLLSTRGGGEIHIRLQPRHFGNLQISVRVEDGQVVTRLMAESPVVREWLQSNQGLLRQALEEQGLVVSRLDVPESEAESRARQERQSRGDESEDGQPRRRRPDTGAVFEVVA
jgi:hypothetical protein